MGSVICVIFYGKPKPAEVAAANLAIDLESCGDGLVRYDNQFRRQGDDVQVWASRTRMSAATAKNIFEGARFSCPARVTVAGDRYFWTGTTGDDLAHDHSSDGSVSVSCIDGELPSRVASVQDPVGDG